MTSSTIQSRLLSLLTAIIICMAADAQQSIDLSGQWRVTTVGQPPAEFTGNGKMVTLPGSNLTNDIGLDPTLDTKWTCSIYDSSFFYNPKMEEFRNAKPIKYPFFLTPNKHFIGHLVYSTNITVPEPWKGKSVVLYIERPHIETTVSVDGRKAGHRMSLSTPHVYDITPLISYGRTSRIDIDVYNGIENVDVGQDSHSVTDQTQGNWNGIVGAMKLIAVPKSVAKACGEDNPLPRPRVTADARTGNVSVVFPDETMTLHIDNPQLWSAATPVVYHRIVRYHGMDVPVAFGFRDISVDGRHILLNGKEIWIRGTVGNCNFPLTGYPPMDVESWMRIFRKMKEYGLNAMRFHSYCPPEAAFTAADSVGIYLQPEGPSWPNHGVKLGKGQPVDSYLATETRRIVDTYGNHPSFVMMALGNEPAGDWVRYCNAWVDTMKSYDPRRIYCGASVGGGWAWDSGSEYHVKAGARGLDWDKAAPQSTDDYDRQILFPRNYKGSEPNNSPVIAHEQGQWCAFPDLNERNQYTGVYKAYNFDIFDKLLHDNGMAAMARKFLMSSGKLQTLAYKFETERNLRTADYSGFLYLGLNDYSGQGTALVGPLNVFWREKGYVDGKDWREFCNDFVIMAEFPKFTFRAGEKASVDIDFYNATGEAHSDATVGYTVTDGTTVVKQGSANADIATGKTRHVFSIALPTDLNKPKQLTLRLSAVISGRSYTNHYDYWVYPDVEIAEAKGIYIADSLDAKALRTLAHGGKVLLTAAGKVSYGSDVRQTYLPVFWNTSWFKMRPPHTTGAYIDCRHPLFKEFPTDDWTNLNWWELLNKAQVMNLAEFPADYESPVQPIDTWHVSRKLGMIVEAKVLKGKLLMTTMDIATALDRRIVARQMRKAIIDYMTSDAFAPTTTVDVSVISDLYKKTAPPVMMFTKESPDELKPKLK